MLVVLLLLLLHHLRVVHTAALRRSTRAAVALDAAAAVDAAATTAAVDAVSPFSTVAWGVNEGASCFRVCSWELGVMIIPARPKRFPLPFTANAKRYQLESGSAPPDRPWGTGAVLERLRGQGDAELAARANVARCIVCFEAIVSAGGSGGSSARGGPTILRQTFGELSSATSRSAAAHASSAGDGQAAAAAGGTDGTLPRICLFLDLRAAANSSCGKHD